MNCFAARMMQRVRRQVMALLAGVVAMVGIFAELRAQDGTIRWGGGFNLQGSIGSSPAVGPDGTIYVGVQSRKGTGLLVAITRAGTLKWNAPFETTHPIDSSPTIGSDGTIYVGCEDGKLYAINSNGTLKWAYDTHASAIFTSSPAIGPDGTIYIGDADSSLHAVAPNGIGRWTFATGDSIDSSPAVGADGTIYFGSYDKNVYAVTAGGQEKWRFPTGGIVVASPAIGADGTIYIGSFDQRIYALSPNGERKWDFFTNGRIWSSAVLGADGTIYCGSTDNRFYALSPINGNPKWSANIGTTTASTAAVRADGSIIVCGDDRLIRALNSGDGSVRWTYTIDNRDDFVESSPVVDADGFIYVGSIEGMLYALNGTVSPLSIFSLWPMRQRDAVHSSRFVPRATAGRLINLSTRGRIESGNFLSAGFVVSGTSSKAFLLRGVGPGLVQFGLGDVLADPTLTLRNSVGQAILPPNDNWSEQTDSNAIADTATALEAFALQSGSKDSALLARALPPGVYTATIGAADGGSGVALVEVYDVPAGDPSARLINLSTLGRVGTGDNILIAGLVIRGSGPAQVLVRAIGPGLTPFGVSGLLARPSLSILSRATGASILTNQGWTSTGMKGDLEGAALYAGAFPIADGSADCAAVLKLEAGDYTIQISGVGGTTGVALVEVYTFAPL